MEIQCKNFRNISLLFLESGSEKLYEYVMKFAFPEKTTNLFAYDHIGMKYAVNGWAIYDPDQELGRIFGGDLEKSGWRITKINEDFGFCKSYPKKLVVPLSVSDEELRKVAEFRSKGLEKADLH